MNEQRRARAAAGGRRAPAGSARGPRRRASRQARRRSGLPVRGRGQRRSQPAGAGRRRADADSGPRNARGRARHPPAPRQQSWIPAPLRHVLDDQRLGDDRSHALPRVQGLVRVLEDHLDPAAQVVGGWPCHSAARRRGRSRPRRARPTSASPAQALTCRSRTRRQRPRISPSRHSSETPSTARAVPRSYPEVDRRGREPPSAGHGSSRSSGGPRLHASERPCSGHSSQRAKWHAAAWEPRPRAVPGPRPGNGPARTGSAAGSCSPAAARRDRAGRRGSGVASRGCRRSSAALEQALRVGVLPVGEDRIGTGPDLRRSGPAYMIAMRSQVSASTPRSCEIRMSDRPRRSRRLSSSSSTCACMTTSSAVVGSSAITSDGLHASASAIITRWRWPPES